MEDASTTGRRSNLFRLDFGNVGGGRGPLGNQRPEDSRSRYRPLAHQRCCGSLGRSMGRDFFDRDRETGGVARKTSRRAAEAANLSKTLPTADWGSGTSQSRPAESRATK